VPNWRRKDVRTLSVVLVVGIACLVVGCAMTPKSSSPAIGMKAQDMIAAHEGHRIEIYNPAGEKVDTVPELSKKETGSVSIYNIDVTGQDNYTFNRKHVIMKHMRSYGDDFAAGTWTEVK
jgi:hypothetical protein